MFGIVWKLITISKQRHLKPNLIDSMITLAWIKGYPNHWKTFVANHVSQIQVNSRGNWRHTEENSADLLSRGMRPPALQEYLMG